MDALAAVFTALTTSGPLQQNRLLRLHTALGPDVLVAEALAGVESIDGDGFRLELTALSVDAHLDLAGLLGQPVLLELLTADALDDLRPLHGHVTAFERVGSNGGLARYRLRIEPWLALLRQRVDSYAFQDMTVVEIVESVFADYAEGLVPAWRWELADRAVYAKRSLTTQYEESDFDFVQRLLAEEGLYTWFEHAGDTAGERLGTHTLVLADHAEAFAELGAIRFHRRDVTERADSIQHWSTTRRWRTTRVSRASWDYRSLGLRPAEAAGDAFADLSTEDVDVSGPYGYPDRATGERRARQHLDALQVVADTVHGQGSWRQLRPGARFTLTQHPRYADADSAGFVCLRLQHSARNNLGAEVLAAVEQQLGRAALPPLPLPEALDAQDSLSRTAGEGWGEGPAVASSRHPRPSTGSRQAGHGPGGDPATLPSSEEKADGFYHNTFHALPAAVPYRPQTVDGHGLRLHPKPSVHGTQTAIVVSDGAPLQTDRDHRIKVQFHWQRGADAGNRQAHPAGEDNAPGNEKAWTWVRVASPWAGDNWGGVFVPRRGQEVVVAFLEGDIDRPVVIGTVYNGQGQAEAAHNQRGGGAAGATGNAAAWFEGNEHPVVYAGFKTQALAESQGGSGGYQQLRLDASAGQGRAQLSTTQHASTLTLGHLKGGQDNVRGGERGFGAELSTQASGALRAGAGLLLTTEPGTQQLTAPVAQAQLAQGEQLLDGLAKAAKNQQAGLPNEPDELAALKALKATQDTMKATAQGSAAGEGVGGGEGQAPGWSAPLLAASSPDGLIAATPADQVWVSGTQTVLTADQDLNWASQGEWIAAVAGGVVLYTQGSEAPGGKPNQERGIALHAAQGKVSARAHQNLAKLAAQTSVTLASTQADVAIQAPSKHLLATAAGAYLRIEGGNIELGAPGTIEFKASKKELTTAKSASAQATLPKGGVKLCEFKTRSADAAGGGIVPVG